MAIPRREARKIIAAARRVTHFYRGLGTGRDFSPAADYDVTQVEPDVLAKAFEANRGWKMEARDSFYIIYVPNRYAYEHFEVEV